MRLALVGVRKYWTRTASLVSILVAVALVALEFILLGVAYRSSPNQPGMDRSLFQWFFTFPSAYDGVLSMVFSFGGLIGLIYVAAVSGSEWTWGTLKVAISRGESRSRYVAATFASLALILLIGVLVTFVVGLASAALGASIAGLSLGTAGDAQTIGGVGVKLVRCWIAICSLAAVGYAFAMVAKSQMAGIGAVIGFFLASVIAPALLPEVVQQVFRYLPFSIAADAMGLSSPPTTAGGPSVAIDATLALGVTFAWMVGSVAIAALMTERTEIKG